MAKTALLTLGRLPKALEMARALHGAGWRVVIADPFRWHLSTPSRAVDRCIQVPSPVDDETGYLDALMDIVGRESVNLVVPVSEEAMFASGLKARLPGETVYFGPGRTLIRSLHDKLAFVERAKRLELAVPETHLLGTDGAARLAQSNDTVLKHQFSCAGLGISFHDKAAPLPAPGDAPVLVQAKLPGAARSSVSIAHDGRVLGSVFYEGTVLSHTVSVAFRRIDAPDLAEWIAPFVAACEYTGLIAFDFIDDADGVAHAIECNPRANSGVHFFEPEDLAAALTRPQSVTQMRHRKERLMQQVLPCLTETQASVFNAERRRNNLKYLFGSRDVTWSGKDPWPLILMTPTSYEILKRSIFKGESFGEAAVADIAWDGRP